MRQNHKVKVWLFISAGFMAIGGFGPWATVFGISVDGTNGDGWFVILPAAAGAGLFYAMRARRWAGAWAIGAGAIGLATTAYDRTNLEHIINQGSAFTRALLHVGWGLDIALLASISMLIAGVVAIAKVQRAASTAETETPPEPAAG